MCIGDEYKVNFTNCTSQIIVSSHKYTVSDTKVHANNKDPIIMMICGKCRMWQKKMMSRRNDKTRLYTCLHMIRIGHNWRKKCLLYILHSLNDVDFLRFQFSVGLIFVHSLFIFDCIYVWISALKLLWNHRIHSANLQLNSIQFINQTQNISKLQLTAMLIKWSSIYDAVA